MRKALMVVGCALFVLAGCADSSDPVAIDGVVRSADSHETGGGGVAGPVSLSAPVFGLANSFGRGLLAAETFVGVTRVRNGGSKVLAELGGVTGVTQHGRTSILAVTGAPLDPSFAENAFSVFLVNRAGRVRQVANLEEFELAVNPDQVWNSEPPESNPFNVAYEGGRRAYVADAAANDIVSVDRKGNVDWVAVLTPQLASTEPLKELIGCVVIDGGPVIPPECDLPDEIMAQPVATSVAIGPDGSIYAGELTGFPSPPGISRVWRINREAHHVLCPSSMCTLFADGFTSIMDLKVGPDGTLYVVEFDEAGWLAVEILSGFPLGPVEGGTVNACDTGSGACTVLADGLSLPTAVAVEDDGSVWVAENSAIPFGTATVRPLP